MGSNGIRLILKFVLGRAKLLIIIQNTIKIN